MTSSGAIIEPPIEELRAIAAKLCGSEVDALAPVHGGGNSRVYWVQAGENRYALKNYPSQSADQRNRLGAEFGAFELLWLKGVTNVPKAIACDRGSGFAVYEWVAGEPIGTPSSDDVDNAISFANQLRSLAASSEARSIPAATEATFSGQEIVDQIDRRFGQLRAIADGYNDLSEFLFGSFETALENHIARAISGFHQLSLAFDERLPASSRTLSPSDFGFHNALRRSDGSICFLDFEYFGWDDPVRLAADFLLHPGMSLGETLRERFLKGMLEAFSGDDEFRMRLAILFPLIGMRWCMILLNEFHSEGWRRRQFAGSSRDRESVLAEQLQKARTMLLEIDDIDFEPDDGQ